MNFNPFEYLRDSRSMDDSMDIESTKGASDSDRKPFSKLDELEEERVDPLDCLEGNTSMIDSKDGEKPSGAVDSDKNPLLSWTSLGRKG